MATTAEAGGSAATPGVPTMSSQWGLLTLANIVTPFSGVKKEFKNWTKDLERTIMIAEIPEAEKSGKTKTLALMTSRGPVRECISRRMRDVPAESWTELCKELKTRYAPFVEPSTALATLQRARQKPNQPVQDFVEYIKEVAYEAFPDSTDLKEPLVDKQLSQY